MPAVSVIIPCFNAAAVLGRTLRSLSLQRCTDWEIIVVDDGSTDDLAGAIHRFGSLPVVSVRLEKNQGPGAARNAGLQVAQGEFIQFLDAGDTIEQDKIEEQLACFSLHTSADAVFSDYTICYGWCSEKVSCDPGNGGVFRHLLDGNLLAIHSLLFRRGCLAAVNGFDESLPQCEDWELWMRLLAKGYNFVYIPGYTARYVKTPGSSTRDIVPWTAALEKMIDTLRHNDSLAGKADGRLPVFVASVYFMAAWRLLFSRRIARALRYAACSFAQSPRGFFHGAGQLFGKAVHIRKTAAPAVCDVQCAGGAR